jgi:hypothetical protein
MIGSTRRTAEESCWLRVPGTLNELLNECQPRLFVADKALDQGRGHPDAALGVQAGGGDIAEMAAAVAATGFNSEITPGVYGNTVPGVFDNWTRPRLYCRGTYPP